MNFSETRFSERIIASYQMFQPVDLPRSRIPLRKKDVRRTICAITFFTVILLFLALVSKQSYYPQPLQCINSTNADPKPRPLVVIAAGGRRAGSTFLYNALRILLRIRDPNTVAGWYVDLQHLYNSYAQVMPRNGSTVSDLSEGNRIQAFQSVGSLLVKIHTVRDWHVFLGGGDIEPAMEDVVDAVYTSHRDLRDAVGSIRDMGWGVSHTASQMAEKDFCRRKRLKEQPLQYFSPEDYAREDTWITIARTEILCREALIETAGSKLRLDIVAEDGMQTADSETIALLGEIARDLDYAYSNAELELAAKELRRLRASPCDNGFNVEMSLNPVTHLHKGHIRTTDNRPKRDAQEEKRGKAAIERDPVCREWLTKHLYDVDG